MSLALLALGAVFVAIAMFNRVPAVLTPSATAPTRQGARLALVPARLTEAGRAAVTTLGGSIAIVAFFLALSGL
ncbi:hypothetical protein CLV63_11838 [Murinocardiopsis flavida]|uniref:Uncharacterized protein n=1 Tax=Murinocardiopsis flavida TaxID=645275 RepID=A0A2P8D501_9ACTN|nr:hypothetical protein [Murinocardiopsis flavida]PSK92279.1 hypothetical protein CLV63_11838 [Murinocardiopsis flavida]